jgi:ribose transport system substrate-binding protein
MDKIQGNNIKNFKSLIDVDVVDKNNVDAYMQGGNKFEN